MDDVDLSENVFVFNGTKIRVVVEDGVIWFCAQDIADAIGAVRGRDLVSVCDNEERGAVFFRSPSGMQEMVVVNESGLNRIMMRSNKPAAKPFQDWLAKEVLPSIRKTGSYDITRDAKWLETSKKRKAINVKHRASITANGGGSKHVHIQIQRRIGKAATGLYPADLRIERKVPQGKRTTDYWKTSELAAGIVVSEVHENNLSQLKSGEEIIEDADRVCTLFEGFKKAALLK